MNFPKISFLALLSLCFTGICLADDSRLFEVRVDGKTFFYAEVLPTGEAFKAYPKPRVPLGKYSDEKGELKFTPAKSVHDIEKYYPLLANILRPSDLNDDEKELLGQLLFESEGAKVSFTKKEDPKEKSESLKVREWTGPKAKLDWNSVELVLVPAAERNKIEAFEKALLGKWKFVRATDKLGDATKDSIQYKQVEFCADGTCIADSEKKFYWVDGKFLRLSFQKDAAWEEYSMTEEYDVLQPTKNELVLKGLSLNPSFIPSRYKLEELGEFYPAENDLKQVYYFERVKK